MSITRKEALAELQAMFPEYDKRALNTLLRANGKPLPVRSAENMLAATIDYILQLNSEEQQNLK